VREGFAREADTLPPRNLKQSMITGPASGHVVELEPMLDEYYQLMGWDNRGLPTTERLTELGLEMLLEGV
jgi:aldehyde:ferredoxin oxidoreductase